VSQSIKALVFTTVVAFGVVGASSVQAQTTMGYYRTCANYNPDYQETYDNSQQRSGDLTIYLRDSGCRKQIIRAVDIIRDQNKKCTIPRYPDYDTYQRTLIDYLKGSGFQDNDALMNTSIEMVAPEIMKHVLNCS